MTMSTEKALQLALSRMKRGRPRVVDKKRKISIKAVADEAKVSEATIHNRYPGIADEIRQITGKALKVQRDQKTQALKLEKGKSRELRSDVEELESQVKKLVSINAALADENARLKAEIGASNVVRINDFGRK